MQGGEDEMAGERSLNGNLRRLQIARFAHHDSVRVLPQKCAQDSRKGQPDVLIHRHLHDAFEVVFDRLFRRQQLWNRSC